MKPKLTPRQQRFCEEYLIDLNATQAAIRAGYSEATAHVQGPRLLDKVAIRKFLEERRAERSEETKIDAAWVLKRLAAEAEADVADLYDDNGDLLPVKEWPLIWRQGLVQGIDVDALYDGAGQDRIQIGQIKKIRLSDRVKRLELIGKHIGVKAFEDTLKGKVEGNLTITVNTGVPRAPDE